MVTRWGSRPGRVVRVGLVALILAFIGACGTEERDSGQTAGTEEEASVAAAHETGSESRTYRDPKNLVAATIPRPWKVIRDPVTSVLYPRQVLAVASFRTGQIRAPRTCSPAEILNRMPKRGALLTIVEYTPRATNGEKVAVPKLPVKGRKLSYRDGTYANFECAGPSYKFEFSRHGRAFQAQVWFNRRLVTPSARAAALKIIRSFCPMPRWQA